MAYFQYRGAKGLLFAPLITDDDNELTYGEIFKIDGLKSISKSVSNESNTVFADDIPALVSMGQGEETITLTTTGISLADKAKLGLAKFDDRTGGIMEGSSDQSVKYFAVAYSTGTTNNDLESYGVWRYKCTVSLGDQASNTKDNSAESSDLTLTVTAINTAHKFTNSDNESLKGYTVNFAAGLVNREDFFSKVTTPDNIETAKCATPTATPAPSAIPSGNTVYLTSATADAVIYYTTDGTTPTAESTAYTNGITISGSTTIKAIATKSGLTNSEVATFAYTTI